MAIGFTYVLLSCMWCAGVATQVHAQDAAAPSAGNALPAAAFSPSHIAAALAQAAGDEPQLVAPPRSGRPSRPKSLVPLYVSFASLQALDVHSTTRALNRGAVEANPLLKNLADNPLAFGAVKVAGSAGIIYVAEKMWKKNRKAAVIFMAAANAGMAFIVQHNYRAVK